MAKARYKSDMPDGRERRRRTTTGDVAIVAATPAIARGAAAWLARDLPAARLRPFSLPGYCARRSVPLPLVLATAGLDRDADRAFLLEARDRLLWPPAAGDLYDAIAGVLTHLLPRGATPALPPGLKTALLLEGELTRERARAALTSSARHWIVEHVGLVRLSAADLVELAGKGVSWSALHPTRLLGVASCGAGERGIFPRGTRLFQRPSPVNRARRAPRRKPSIR
ncbi:MAG: hypothetical protein ABJC07_03385 [Acidobacteriota bacterium]